MKNLILITSLCVAAVSCTTKPHTHTPTTPTPVAATPTELESRTVAQASNVLSDKIKAMEKKFKSCINSEEGQSTQGSIRCAMTWNKSADAELNYLYNKVMTKYSKGVAHDKEIAKRFKDAQRAWITFRDANCKLLGTQMLGGTGEGQIIAGCTAESTSNRLSELNDFIGYEY